MHGGCFTFLGCYCFGVLMLFLPRSLPLLCWVRVSSAEFQESTATCAPAICGSLGLQFNALGPTKIEPFGWSKDALNCFEIFGWKEWKRLVMSSSLSECRHR